MVDKPIGKQTKGVQLALGLVFDCNVELLYNIDESYQKLWKFKKSHLYPAQVYLY